MGKKKFLITAVIAVCVLVGAWALYKTLAPNGDTSGTSEQAASSDIETYDFTVYDKAGNSVKLSDYKGKPVVVNFWASWCGYCQREMPDFQTAYEKYGDRIQFMMIDNTGTGNESAEDGDKTISEGGYTFPVFYDNDASAADAYTVRSLPLSLFVGADGKVKYIHDGVISSDKLNSYIEDLL